jgi:antitoxin component YwqK of YwqJK toxin-antitoxin module
MKSNSEQPGSQALPSAPPQTGQHERPTRHAGLVAIGFGFACALVATIFLIARNPQEEPPTLRQLTRDQLVLRENVLYETDAIEPFDGTMVEYYPGRRAKLTIEIQAGKPHGTSHGYYENGQAEVEEHFTAGISNGRRIRWFENGQKKSAADIVDGKIEGTFTRWHPNGQKAAEAQMVDGKPEGLSQGWHESGVLKSRVELEDGKIVSRQFWEDDDA